METQFLVKVKSNLQISMYSCWFYGQEFIIQLPLYKNTFKPLHAVDPFTIQCPLCQFLLTVWCQFQFLQNRVQDLPNEIPYIVS